jgi:ABC-type uncharacterized transport system permease subunit|tara:strand:- start:4657 stop:5730 length:1074 start_codon:yes stop_codon:yes gene_type:complete
MTNRDSWIALAVSLSALLLTALLTAAALALGGYSPLVVLQSLLEGSFGSLDIFFGVTLVRAIPLVVIGLAVTVAFKSGVWNIGAEGQFYAGSMAGVWVGLSVGDYPSFVSVPLVFLSAAAAGAIWALLPALMRIRLGVGEVVTTILMNFVAIHLVSYVVRWPLQESRGVFPNTDLIDESVRLPIIIPGTGLHLGFVVAVICVVGLSIFFNNTGMGFQLRAMGGSKEATRVSGRARIPMLLIVTFLLSGSLAGLAGGIEITGRTFALYEGMSPGWGYTAIAVALLADLNFIAVLVTGIFFGALEGGAGAMQREAGIPAAWVSGIEALVLLSVLASDRILRRLLRSKKKYDVKERELDV